MRQPGSTRRLLLWFRNDLRVHDNYTISEAARLIKSRQFAEVLPVYVFDPRNFIITPFGNPKTGGHRAQFLLESVADLKQQLRRLGSDLAVTVGKPEHILPGLLMGCPSSLVLTMEESTSEEKTVDAAVVKALDPAGSRLQKVWGHTLYHLDDLQGNGGPFSSGGIKTMPNIFTPFKEQVERRCQVRALAPTPGLGSLPLPDPAAPVAFPGNSCHSSSRGGGGAEGAGSVGQLLAWEADWASLPWPDVFKPKAPPAKDPRAVLDYRGGETVALARLKYYLWDSDLLATYFDTRNGMLGGDYSTKFSAWMAAGCLSPRQVYHEIKRYEQQRTANKSTYWVVFELLWRDFFRFYAIKHGSRIFFETGPIGKSIPWSADPSLLQRWQEGRTGMPLVDANMREIAATGFMSNRGRQNVASYLVLDLGVDWRKGADWFESLLLDHDVTSNWGNWVAAAGLTGGRINAFNITKQSKDYDLMGEYLRTWLPELAKVPAPHIHEPWLMSKQDQDKYGVQIGVDYPAPVPASQLARPHSAYGASRGNGRPYSGRGSRDDNGPGRGGGVGRGAGGRGGRGQPTRRSEFERFG